MEFNVKIHGEINVKLVFHEILKRKISRCILPCRIYLPNKVEDVNLKIFNMIKEINESKTFAEHISCECKSEFNGRECNSRRKRNMISVGESVENH